MAKTPCDGGRDRASMIPDDVGGAAIVLQL
jgi:hypothetical protein